MARVVGFEGGQSGITPATYGPASPVNEVGVWGDSDTGLGVFGSSNALDRAGVVGHSNRGEGVIGYSAGALGVMGIADTFPGVYGSTRAGNGTVGHSQERIGVWGSAGFIGTYGFGFNSDDKTAQTAGVVGEVFGSGAKNSPGVIGGSSRGPGVHGISTEGSGVLGWGTFNGVEAVGRDTGVLAFSTRGPAGNFLGDVRVHGTFYKSGGGFRIDHPQNPENKYLTHSFVESDDMKNVYDGVAILDQSGAASVQLPSWFQELNGDYRYQLTPIGEAAPDLHIAKEVTENSFEIAGGHTGLKVCWQVTGTRQDPWANANRIEVEEDKAEGERGYYLHPDLYDQPEEQGIGFAALPEEVRQMKQQLEEEEVQPPELPSILDDPRLEEQRQQMEELRRRYHTPSQRTESSEE
jgi:hypothetical protein